METLDRALKSHSLKEVFRHWREASGAKRLPGWNDLRPSRIARHLPIVWAYTYDPVSDIFTGRLAGDRIEAIFGMSFRNTPLAQIFPQSQYQDVFQRAKRVVSEPALHRGEGVVFRQLDKFGYGERLMMPLAADGAHPDGILGCTDYQTFMAGTPDDTRQVEQWYPV